LAASAGASSRTRRQPHLGGLATGGKLQQFPGGPLPALNLIELA